MLITVFTSTYNRSFCLPEVYDSLLRQSNQNFEWVIVDDGSSDNTPEWVKEWMNENRIKINYLRQENKGMLGAHNAAHSVINTKLCVCVDSDDSMPSDGIKI